MRKTFGAFSAIALAALAVSAPQPLAAQSSRLVVASGLNNPRGLTFGSDGALYVAEAGRGGDSTSCLPPIEGIGPPRCYGPTGSITRVTGLGVHSRVVTGLASAAPSSGSEATGPIDINFGFGGAWVTIGLGADPAARNSLTAGTGQFGHLARIEMNGQWAPILDLAALEATTNPDNGDVDSNPYAFILRSSGAVFTDAGANALINVTPAGAMSTLAVFPTRTAQNPFGPGTVQMQSVPTSVVEAPDGSLFVGELTGFPFPVGGARVYRVPANGGTPVVVAQGFTNIIDIAYNAATGVGYVLEHDADGILGPGQAGRLMRVAANGTVTEVAGANLTKPGGLTIGPDGALYITNMSTSAGAGEVVRLVP